MKRLLSLLLITIMACAAPTALGENETGVPNLDDDLFIPQATEEAVLTLDFSTPTPAPTDDGMIDLGGATDVTPAEDTGWRDQYFAFLQSQGYIADAVDRLGLETSEFQDSFQPNTTFALHDMDDDGTPELLVSLYETRATEPRAVFFYTCDAASPRFLSGIRPGCYMFEYADDPAYPGLAGCHRMEDDSDEWIYLSLVGDRIEVQPISRVTYGDSTSETCVTDDARLFELFSVTKLMESGGSYFMLFDWAADGLTQESWNEYLEQGYDAPALEAERGFEDETTSEDSAYDADDDAYDDYSDSGDYSAPYGVAPQPYRGQPVGTVRAVSGDTHVRTGPGLYYSKLGVLYRYSSAPYTGGVVYDERGVAWYSILWNNTDAWVSSRYTAIY